MSFEVKKSRLIEVEAKIRSVVGNEPDYVKIPCEEHSRIELLLLLDERRSLLNWMFKETPEEWERMKVVNSRLLELTKELRLKMADICDGLAKRKRDALDDDYVEFLKAETVTMIIHGLMIPLLLKTQKSIFVIRWRSFVVTLAIRLRMYSS